MRSPAKSQKFTHLRGRWRYETKGVKVKGNNKARAKRLELSEIVKLRVQEQKKALGRKLTSDEMAEVKFNAMAEVGLGVPAYQES